MPKKEGTVQFLLSFSDALCHAGVEVRVYLPTGVCDNKNGIFHYNLICLKDTLPLLGSKVREAVRSIEELSPDKVIFTDEGRGSLAVLELLEDHGVKTAMVVHDPSPHPSRSNGGLKTRLSSFCYRVQWNRVFNRASEYILLSNTSNSKFRQISPDLAARSGVMPLCPHPPVGVIGGRPDGLDCDLPNEKFYLFFGCIDEYKGLGRLMRAYAASNRKYPLVVAGGGSMSAEERELSNRVAGIHLLNRFISDEEMVWLFEHCLCVCLPYIEASQSGVLAMAYWYGKPVIVSNLNGLTEFVDQDESGLIFDDEEWLIASINQMAEPGRAE